jgi:hypothetical protein
MFIAKRFCLFILVVAFSSVLAGEGEPSPKVKWELSIAFREWYATDGKERNEGDSENSDSDFRMVTNQDEAFSPGLEFEAIRHRFYSMLFYQFPTTFRGEQNINGRIVEQRVDREDAELYMGWRFAPLGSEKTKLRTQLAMGYKRIAFIEDDPFTVEVNDDYQTRIRGPMIASGLVVQRKGRTNWTFGLTLAYAELTVRETQVPLLAVANVDSFEYDATGFLIDLSFNIYIHHRVQWMIGYKIQDYQPAEDRIATVVHLPNIGTINRSAGTIHFKAEGAITGFLWKF